MTGAVATTAGQEWRHGWRYVALTAVGLTCAPSTLPVYTLGVFVKPLAAEFGWSRGAIQLAILFSTGLGAVGAPVAGRLVKRLGVRRTVASGIAGIALALVLAASQSGALWQLYGCYALMALLGAGAGGVAWSSLITGAFARARGFALGVALSGTGLAAVLAPQIAVAALDHGGWRTAYLALAAFAALFVMPLCWFGLPRRDGAAGAVTLQTVEVAGLTTRQAMQSWRFWIIGIATAAAYAAVGGSIPNLVPALTDHGIPTALAVTTLGSLGLSIIVARIIVGALLDRFWAPAVAAMVLLPAAAASVAFALPGDLRVYAGAAAALGAATGMELDILAFLTARYFGMRDFARIYARLYVFLAAPAGLAPLAFGNLFDATGSYRLPFLISAALLVAAAIALLTLGRYPPQFAPADRL